MSTIRTLIEQQLRLAKFTGKKYRLKKVERLGYPVALEIRYRKKLREIAEFLSSLIEKHLIVDVDKLVREAKSERLDAYDTALESIIKTIQNEFGNKYSEDTIRYLASEQANLVSNFHRNRLTRILSNSIGTDVFLTEPYLQTSLRSFVQENVDLITSIPQEQFTQVRLTVKHAIRSGKTTAETEKEIKERWGDALKDKPVSRAELIARDQNGKLFGELNMLRQTELGVEKYIWRTVRDARVREHHRDKEGKVFAWNKPPEDSGHPGYDYQCRCWAEPVVLSAVPADVSEEIPDPQPIPKPVRKASNIFANWQIDNKIEGSIKGGFDAINKVYKPKRLEIEPVPIKASYGQNTTGKLTLEGKLEAGRGLVYRPRDISVSKKSKAKEFTFAHEFGHYVDFSFGKQLTGKWVPGITRSDPRFEEFWKSIYESKAVKNLMAYNPPRQFLNLDDYLAWKKTLPGPPMSDKYQRYLMQEREIWARAFSQFVAKESKDANLIAQIQIERANIHQFAQWDDDDFKPIRKAIRKLLDDEG